MNMSIRPRYLVLALVAGVGLYLAGVSLGTVLFLAAGAYMLSMHLGGHGGHGGHGDRPTEIGDPSGTSSPVEKRAHHR